MIATFSLTLVCAFFWISADDGKVPTNAKVGPQAKSGGSHQGSASQPIPSAKKSPPDKTMPDEPSLAERIAQLKRSIANDLKSLEAIKQEEEDPKSEYRQAEARFQMLDTQWMEQAKKLQTFKDAGKKQEVEVLEKELRTLKRQRDLAKDQFNLTIQERMTSRAKAVVLRTKVQQDQKALRQLTGEAAPAVDPQPPNDKTNGAQAAQPATPGKAEKEPPPQSTLVPPPARPGAAASTQRPAQTPPVGANAKPSQAEPKAKPVTKEVLRAREEAKSKEVAASEANKKVQSVAERIDSLRKNIDLEQKLLDTAMKKAQQAKEALPQIDRDIQRMRALDPDKVGELTQQKADTAERLAKASQVMQASKNRLSELRDELHLLQQEQRVAQDESAQKHGESVLAQKKVAQLENPFTLHNILEWLIIHGPKLLAIVIGMGFFHLLVRMFSRRIAQMIARSSGRGTEQDRENRSLTLISVFRNSASLAIFGGGIFMILDEIDIPIMPLMGGAAVIGLAVAFGAQNLIRDYFSGFMVLMEDQYGINDVVHIGDIAGVVEKISLRMTVLRDIRGVVHFIPHGTIQRVSNLTHGWSRAYFEIGVAYKEDPDRVMDILVELAKEMRNDPVHGPDILEDPEMLGVDSLGESAINICFFIKTKPLKQWPVQRELLRRIKRKFDKLHIEIPFPHRTVYHHYENDNAMRLGQSHHGRDAEAAA